MNEILYSDTTVWYQFTDSIWIVFVRFMCGIVLHMYLNGKLRQGLILMKYSVNHPWKFDGYKIAFMCGFLQSYSVVLVEILNFTVVLTDFTAKGILTHFLLPVIIT